MGTRRIKHSPDKPLYNQMHKRLKSDKSQVIQKAPFQYSGARDWFTNQLYRNE